MQKEEGSQKESEREAALENAHEQLEAKTKEISFLQKQKEELAQKLQQAGSKSSEKVIPLLKIPSLIPMACTNA